MSIACEMHFTFAKQTTVHDKVEFALITPQYFYVSRCESPSATLFDAFTRIWSDPEVMWSRDFVGIPHV